MYHLCVSSTPIPIYTHHIHHKNLILTLIHVIYSLNEVSGEKEGDDAYSDAYESELSDYSSSLDQINDGASDGEDDDTTSDSTSESSTSGSSRSGSSSGGRSGNSGSYTPVTSAEGEDEEYFDWTHIAKGRHKRSTTASTSNTAFPSISASFAATQPTSTSSVKRSSTSSASASSSPSLWESSSMTNLQTVKQSTQTRRPVKNNGKS